MINVGPNSTIPNILPLEGFIETEEDKARSQLVLECLKPSYPDSFSFGDKDTLYVANTYGTLPIGDSSPLITSVRISLEAAMKVSVPADSNFEYTYYVGLRNAALLKKSKLGLPDPSTWKTSFVKGTNTPDFHIDAGNVSSGYFGEMALWAKVAYPNTPFARDFNEFAQTYFLHGDRVPEFLNKPDELSSCKNKLRVLACMRLLYPDAYEDLSYAISWKDVLDEIDEVPFAKPEILFYTRVLLADSASITPNGEIEIPLMQISPVSLSNSDVPVIPM